MGVKKEWNIFFALTFQSKPFVSMQLRSTIVHIGYFPDRSKSFASTTKKLVVDEICVYIPYINVSCY